MDSLVGALVSALVGLLIAPYLHVLIRRTPIHQRLAVKPHCFNCGTAFSGIQRHSLVARIKGQKKCVTCQQDLWPDAPILEIATVVLFAVVGWQLQWAWALPAYWVFFAAAVVIVVVDLRLYIIPTWVVYPAVLICLALFAVAAAAGGDFERLGWAAASMVGCWFFYFIFWFFYPRGMGLGDVRLALLVGLVTGWIGLGNAVLALLVGLILGAAVGLALVATRLRTRKDAIPFGPFMVAGAALTVLFTDEWRSLIQAFTGS